LHGLKPSVHRKSTELFQKQNKTKQNKTKQNKTKQNKTNKKTEQLNLNSYGG
jgi:hypothetical protein